MTAQDSANDPNTTFSGQWDFNPDPFWRRDGTAPTPAFPTLAQPWSGQRVEIQARSAAKPGVQSLGVYLGWCPPLPARGERVEDEDGEYRTVSAVDYAYAPYTVIVTLWLD